MIYLCSELVCDIGIDLFDDPGSGAEGLGNFWISSTGLFVGMQFIRGAFQISIIGNLETKSSFAARSFAALLASVA